MSREQSPSEYASKVQPVTALREISVPRENPLIVGDVNGYLRPNRSPSDLDLAMQILIATSFENSALYVNATLLRDQTVELLDTTLQEIDVQRTAIVIPGYGAQSVCRENDLDSRLKSFRRFDIPTQRIVDNGKVAGVSVAIPMQYKEQLRAGDIRNVVVIDDVVATGTTLRTLRTKIQKESPIPVDFQAITWFCRRPTDVTGFRSVRSIYQYWSAEGWPALNSISTWLKSDEKAAAVLKRYKQRFAKYPYGFDKQLAAIKALVNMEESL